MSVNHITTETFQTQVMESKGTALIDFWAPRCMPCKMLGPVIEDLGKEYDGKVFIGKVDVDEEPDLAVKFGVMSIPTLVVFKDGKEVSRSVGLQSKQALIDQIEKA